MAADAGLARVLTVDVADGRTTALIEAARRGHVKVRGWGGVGDLWGRKGDWWWEVSR